MTLCDILGKQETGYLNDSELNKIYENEYFFWRLERSLELKGHEGCVNSLSWDCSGRWLVSGSDDQVINVWTPFDEDPWRRYNATIPTHAKYRLAFDHKPMDKRLLHQIPSAHEANIFATKFWSLAPKEAEAWECPERILSCAADGTVLYTNLNDYCSSLAEGSSSSYGRPFRCHTDFAFDVEPDPHSPHCFFSCSNDGTVNQYDLRIASSCDCSGCNKHTIIDIGSSRNSKNYSKASWYNLNAPGVTSAGQRIAIYMRQLKGCSLGVMAMAINSADTNYITLGCSDGFVRMYDRRMLKEIEDVSTFYGQDVYSPAVDSYRAQVYSFLPLHLRARMRSELLLKKSRGTVANEGETEDSSENEERDDLFADLDTTNITSVSYNNEGELLVSYSDNHIYVLKPSKIKTEEWNGTVEFTTDSPSVHSLRSPTSQFFSNVLKRSRELSDAEETDKESPVMDLPLYSKPLEFRYEEDVKNICFGHGNKKTMIKEARFLSYPCNPQALPVNGSIHNHAEEENRNNYSNNKRVMGGSDDGHVFFWELGNDRIVLPSLTVEGDGAIVNCVQGNPVMPVVACSGIDSTIKILTPSGGCATEYDNKKKSDKMIYCTAELIKMNTGRLPLMLPFRRRLQSFYQ
ncbi:hypothetical protein MP638_004977 [Amoeboaphelidium occidentale]|nr:hypothetical protein MP638_004977 [Amoeboaphelidium occidentale]